MSSLRSTCRLKCVLFLVLVICLFPLPAQAQYGGGSGTAAEPYLIYEPNQMQEIGANSGDWNKHFKLMADIDLAGFTGTTFNIIGNTTTKFTGTFDGNGYEISNFTYFTNSSTALVNIGIFGYVDDPHAEIKDLGLRYPGVNAGTANYVGSLVGHLVRGTIAGCYAQGGSVSGDYYIGGLVGGNYAGTVTDCYATASVEGLSDYSEYIGGLVGDNYSTITNSYATASVSGNNNVGGLVGNNDGQVSNCYAAGSVSGVGTYAGGNYIGGLVGNNNGEVSNCYATASVWGIGNYIGGLVGDNWGTISYCYATASVVGTGEGAVGGLVGDNWGTISNCYATGNASGVLGIGGLVGTNYSTIDNCYATASVSGTGDYVGGLVGGNAATVTDSFWDTQTSGQAGSDGGTGKTTAQMQTQSTFTDAGWDFITPLWDICEGTNYPRLAWQIPLGVVVCPEGVNFIDFSIFALAWQSSPGDDNWNPDCDISEPKDNVIDERDLAVLCDHWLQGTE